MFRKTVPILPLAFILTTCHDVAAQWVYDASVPVYRDGTMLENPWAGGLNYPQFSAFDLDGDGVDDLVAFERDGDRVRTFLRRDGRYVYAPQYAAGFPKVRNWMLMVDHNGDGLKDIFAYNVLGIEVWTNRGTPGNPKFEKEYFDYRTPQGVFTKDALKSTGAQGWDVNINVNYLDIPAITDLDGDGRPDILCFGLTTALPQGITLEYFRQTGPLEFTREDYCWGGFSESYTSNEIYLEVCDGRGMSQPDKQYPSTRMMHLGSGILAMDISGNGLMDLILGELSFPNAVVAYNTGDRIYARMTGKDDNFPSEDVPVHLENLPAFYAVDTDGDGQDELLVAPGITGSENVDNILLYKNVSSSTRKSFRLMMRSFLQDGMIDVGEGSRPVFCDVDRDGRPDMLVSTYGYYQKGGGYVSKVAYYRNTGTSSSPAFTFVTDDFAHLSVLGKTGLHPALADLSGDGLTDMVVGDSDGNVHYFTQGRDGSFTADTYYMNGINVGRSAVPVLWDVDGDGLTDMVVGCEKGRLWYFKNTGTRTRPEFTLVSDRWLGLDFSAFEALGSGLYPCIYSENRNTYLLLGLYDGSVRHYRLDASAKGGVTATELSDNILDVSDGRNAAPGYLAASSGKRYVMVGNNAGGITAYSDPSAGGDAPAGTVTVYPNPSADAVHIKPSAGDVVHWRLYDASGRAVLSGSENPFSVAGLAPGVYVLKVEGSAVRASKKVVVTLR